MYDFTKVNAAIPLSKEWILKQLDDSTIFTYYYGRFQIGKAYRSFFDKGDKTPSTMFFVSRKTGRLNYFDFRTDENLDCFGFVKKLYGCNFREAIERIAADFGLMDISTCKVSKQVFEDAEEVEKYVKRNTLIQFEPGQWNNDNLAFWRLYEITEAELIAENVYPVNNLFLNHVEITNPNKHHRYAYIEEYGISKGVTIYSPSDKTMKWLKSIPLDVPYGLQDLPYKSDTLIIGKSKKDLIVLKKLFSDVIATQNESEGALNEEARTLISRRYHRKIVIFDNDDVGLKNAEKYKQKGFETIHIPVEEYLKHGIKDPSDYVKYYSTEALVELFESQGVQTLWH